MNNANKLDNKVSGSQEISTARLLLQRYSKDLVLKYHSWMQDPWLREMTASEPLSLEDEYKAQEEWLLDVNKQTFIIFDKAVREQQILNDRTNNTAGMCGDVNLFLMDEYASESYAPTESSPHVQAAEIMIMIAEPWARRKGYAVEAVRAMMHFGVLAHGVRRYVAKIDDSNEASLGLFTLLGFRVAKKMPHFGETHMSIEVTQEIEEGLRAFVTSVQL